jgi:hypothetical protein
MRRESLLGLSRWFLLEKMYLYCTLREPSLAPVLIAGGLVSILEGPSV